MATELIATTAASASKEIAFIDTSVSGYQTFAQNVKPGVEVVLVDGAQDGLAQIAAALTGRSDIDAIHLFSHGAAGRLQVGTTNLTLASMGDYASELAAIRSAMTAQGDFLIYGCDVAQGDAGAAFVQAFADAVGADVAASVDPTGSAQQGGDWVLETQTGSVEARDALTAAGQTAYGGLLATSANFDSTGLIYANGTTLTASGWTFTMNAAADYAVADLADYPLPINNDGPGDYAVILNLQGVSTVTQFTMKASDNSSFKLQSMQIGYLVGGSSNVTITGYKSGSAVTSGEAVNLTTNDATGSITYAKGSTDTNAQAGTLTFDSAFDNVDEIRFVFGGDTELELDDITVDAPVADTTAPSVSGTIAVPASATYGAGQNLDFTINFDENVVVVGTDSTLGLTVGSTARTATYLSKTVNSITYRYTVQAGDMDADGIAVGAITANSTTVRDSANNDANLSLIGHLPATTGVLVDAIAPAVTGNIAVPANGTYVTGQALSLTVTFDENVTVTGTDSTLGLTVGSTARTATYASKTANSITYTYAV